jgi:hypothetical protein
MEEEGCMTAFILNRRPLTDVAPKGAGCRVYERHDCNLATTCQPIAARSDRDLVWSATIRDISEGGVGLVLGRRFERGTGLAIELPGDDGRSSRTLLAKVVHTTAMAGNKWLLGCCFISRLSPDDVQLVVALAKKLRAPVENKSDARAVSPTLQTAPAKQGAQPQTTQVLTDLWFEGAAHDGARVRLPVRRLFLTGAWPLAPGTILRLWVGDKARHPSGTRVKVLECRKQGKSWQVTYKPLGQLSAVDLKTVGLSG